MYKTPNEFMVRLHHVRPRFKNDLENVLVYMASEITKIPLQKRKEFARDVNTAIFHYPGNSVKNIKTINNWRTEISSLFGFIEHTGDIDFSSLRAMELSETGDLVRFFKAFLYTFQYPGAHVKTHVIKDLIINGVKFKPAKCILSILKIGEHITGKRAWLSKAEICHMIFNDLRVVRDNEQPDITWNRIEKNRNDNVTYDKKGDTIRYASDITDYMIAANLLITHDSKRFYINTLETEAIQKFINSSEWFDGYDSMIDECKNNPIFQPSLDDINNLYDEWFGYINRSLDDTDFSTDILAFLSDGIEAGDAAADTRKYFKNLLKSGVEISAK